VNIYWIAQHKEQCMQWRPGSGRKRSTCAD